MDEVEYRNTYNEACKSVEQITDANVKTALFQILQLIDHGIARITEVENAVEDMQ